MSVTRKYNTVHVQLGALVQSHNRGGLHGARSNLAVSHLSKFLQLKQQRRMVYSVSVSFCSLKDGLILAYSSGV
jgi:hypothetical protein